MVRLLKHQIRIMFMIITIKFKTTINTSYKLWYYVKGFATFLVYVCFIILVLRGFLWKPGPSAS